MRRMKLREHGLKQWLPSWTILCLMYVKEIRWLLRPIHIQSHTPFAVDPHENLWSVLGTGQSAKFTRDQFYDRSFTSEPFIEKYQAKPAISNELSHIMFTCSNCVFRRDREPSRIPEATLKRLRRKGRKLKEFVYERIRPSIPKSSWLRRYVKVRRVTKNDCMLNTKRVRLNKVTRSDEKYLLNCSVRVYQRIIKLSIKQVGTYQCFLVIDPCVFIRVRHTHQTIVSFN